MLLELPERVGVEDRIVPSMLTRRITLTSRLKLDILAGARLHLRVAEDARVRDHGNGEIGVVVVSNDLACLLLLFGLHSILLRHVAEQVPGLGDLLLWLILRQGADEIVCGRGIVARLCGIQHSATLANVEVGQQGGIALDLSGYREFDIDLPLLLVVAKHKVLLIDQERVLGHGLERRHSDRGRDVHGDVELLATLPHGRNIPRHMAVLRILIELVRAVLPRGDRDSSTVRAARGDLMRLAWLSCGGRGLEEVLHATLDEQEHANALRGRLEKLQLRAMLATRRPGGVMDRMLGCSSKHTYVRPSLLALCLLNFWHGCLCKESIATRTDVRAQDNVEGHSVPKNAS